MSDDSKKPENTSEQPENKDGIGWIGTGVAAGAGLAAGAGAHGLIVGSQLRTNLMEPYAAEYQLAAEAVSTMHIPDQLLTASDPAAIVDATEGVLFNNIKHTAHGNVMNLGTPMTDALQTPGTVLGEMRAAAIEANRAQGYTRFGAQRNTMRSNIRPAVEALVAAPAAEKEAAARTLLGTAVAEAEIMTRGDVADKVSHITWLKSMNPLASEGLHLSANQRLLAFAGGVAAVVLGAYATGKVAQWLMQDKSQAGPSK